jgi:tetratricopeptide (TPR) repeat protein
MGYHGCMRVIAALGLALALGVAGTATAQEGNVAAAKDRFDKGQGLYLRGMYDEAALEFIAAYEAKPFPAFLYNAAVCYERARNYERALDFFRRYLEGSPTAPDRAAVTVRMVQLQKLGPTAPPPGGPTPPASQPASGPAPKPAPVTLPPLDTKGLVVVESKPPGALVYLDNKMKGPLGRTPWSGSLQPGDYKILVESKGFKPETRIVRPAGDRLLVLYMALSEEHYLGWIEIEANVPGVNVFVDRREAGPVGRTPFSGFLQPGKHTVTLEREGYVPQQRTITIDRGKPHRLDFKLDLVDHGWVAVGVNKAAHGARVIIDGKLVCQAPCRVRVAPGAHKLVLDQSGFKKYKGTIEVGRAVETQIGAAMSPAPSRMSAYISFAFSAALLGTGTYFAVKSRAEKQDLERDINGKSKLISSDDPRFNSGWTHAIAADALFALGGITGLLGLYYALRSPGPDSVVELKTRNYAVVPVLGPTGVGLAGRF